jgi:predicted enzyme related to lactoylglutathione lyase
MKRRVVGLGGIFFKSKDPGTLKSWYQKHLGLNIDTYGTNFEWRKSEQPNEKAFTQWSPMAADTTYFEPSENEFMINYRVLDLENLVKILEAEGVNVLDSIESFEYGKFVHILDPEGRKIELWEAKDIAYEKIVTDVLNRYSNTIICKSYQKWLMFLNKNNTFVPILKKNNSCQKI